MREQKYQLKLAKKAELSIFGFSSYHLECICSCILMLDFDSSTAVPNAMLTHLCSQSTVIRHNSLKYGLHLKLQPRLPSSDPVAVFQTCGFGGTA